MLRKINRQASTHKLMIRIGQAKWDASLTERPFSPKGTRPYELVEDRMEEGWKDDQKEKEWACRRLQQVEQATADRGAGWVKKSGTAVCGYKK